MCHQPTAWPSKCSWGWGLVPANSEQVYSVAPEVGKVSGPSQTPPPGPEARGWLGARRGSRDRPGDKDTQRWTHVVTDTLLFPLLSFGVDKKESSERVSDFTQMGKPAEFISAAGSNSGLGQTLFFGVKYFRNEEDPSDFWFGGKGRGVWPRPQHALTPPRVAHPEEPESRPQRGVTMWDDRTPAYRERSESRVRAPRTPFE